MRLGANAPHARWTVPSDAVPGSLVKLELRARAMGREALSPPRFVRVVPTSAAAPSLTLRSPSEPSVTSGQAVVVQAQRAGGLAPYAATVRFGQTVLGTLAVNQATPTLLEGTVQMPVVAASLSDNLVVDLVDGASRTASVSKALTVLGNPNPPATPAGLPAQLRVQPYVNAVSVSSSSAGAFTLRLEQDGVVVGEGQAASGALSVPATLTFPVSAVGSAVTLVALAEDVAGRTSSASRSYMLMPSHDAPTVVFVANKPPSSAPEGSTVHVQVQATTSDAISALVLAANGSPVATSGTGILTADFVLPLLTQATHVVFTASATDSTGLQTTATATTSLTAVAPPVVSFVAGKPPPSAPEGATVHVQAQATAAGSVTSMVLTADGVPVASSTAGAVSTDFVLPLLTQATEVVFAAVATDSLGHQGVANVTTALTVDPPPVLSFTASQTTFLVGGAAGWRRGGGLPVALHAFVVAFT